MVVSQHSIWLHCCLTRTSTWYVAVGVYGGRQVQVYASIPRSEDTVVR